MELSLLPEQLDCRHIPTLVKDQIIKNVEDHCSSHGYIPLFILGRGSSFHGGWYHGSDIDITVVYKKPVAGYVFSNLLPKMNTLSFNVMYNKVVYGNETDERKVSYPVEIRFLEVSKCICNLYYNFDFNTVDLFLSKPFHFYNDSNSLYDYLYSEIKRLFNIPEYYNTYISKSIKLVKSLLSQENDVKLAYLTLLRILALSTYYQYPIGVDNVINNLTISTLLKKLLKGEYHFELKYMPESLESFIEYPTELSIDYRECNLEEVLLDALKKNPTVLMDLLDWIDMKGLYIHNSSDKEIRMLKPSETKPTTFNHRELLGYLL